jgi:putative ABC transport system permease protein
VQLNFFYSVTFPVVTNIGNSAAIGSAESSRQLGGYLSRGEAGVETLLELVNVSSTVWRPSLAIGSYPGERLGVLISDKAARDLGVRPGDTITLRYPRRTGLLSYDWTETEVEVSGIHPLSLRFQTYVDIRHADILGLAGQANAIHVTPFVGVTQDEVKKVLFAQFGVASVQAVSAVIRVFEDLIGEFAGIFRVIQLAAIALAVLIAYNSTSIVLDERARDMATMFAFGVRVRTALRVAITENLLTNLLGTAVGYGFGLACLTILFGQMVTAIIPEITMTVSVQWLTLAMAILASLLNSRKLTRMDIPAMLRVME